MTPTDLLRRKDKFVQESQWPGKALAWADAGQFRDAPIQVYSAHTSINSVNCSDK